MMYQWPVYVLLGMAVASPICIGIFFPVGWKRTVGVFSTLMIFLVVEVIMIKSVDHRATNAQFDRGYFEISGVFPEMEFFCLGMLIPLVVTGITMVTMRLKH